MKTSLFDLFKIGIGPSSSHTVGPMRAAAAFVAELDSSGLIPCVDEVQADLYGSLALTGRGHGTDRAVLMGLEGEAPDLVDPASMDPRIAQIRRGGALTLGGKSRVAFEDAQHLIFHPDKLLPGHPNGMRFTAFRAREVLLSKIYYSIGGGFVIEEGVMNRAAAGDHRVPFPFSSAAELLQTAHEHGLAIWELMLENEKSWRSQEEVVRGIERIWSVMQQCTQRGLTTAGVLPGGLNVRRRAPQLFERLKAEAGGDLLNAMDWVNAYAIAVNEENAAGGRVVTAPTNGAAGIIPAIAHYYRRFTPGSSEEGIARYFLTAAAVAVLYKENASISGAEVGCQGEVGVACSMAAAGLVAALMGTNEQVEHAAEIAMEHNLGMTCDPVGGLVQIPCIERNAFGAMNAVNAARMAMMEIGDHKISLDQVIQTMYRTGLDMNHRYKETALGGLALSAIEC
jgi:L-serine dehydratase